MLSVHLLVTVCSNNTVLKWLALNVAADMLSFL